MKNNVEIQRLRIPSGWSININNFYEVDPVEEFIEYYYGSVLIGGSNKIMGLSFDSRYEPEGTPNGYFILVMQKNEYDKNGKIKAVTVLDIKKTKEREDFIKSLEYFMRTGKY
ncbi:hypothetical protein [Vibrio quintilis]|uniref:Uncharacterized protein n=1 Tax=Vibrio quintilis TaxID=1117707 RepID=A0A1M7Z340_9VIBR|nr:hypothetical protein [Vibrio quintilis]SHO59311.1 hypothetical protein VQ7734_05095 [Vibrio quintilis]